MKYNKLIRDKIPEIIKNTGKDPTIHIASESEYWESLKEKLKEEVMEFDKESNEEEFADILEVLEAIKDFKKFSQKDIEDIKKKKAEKRGKFKKKLILDEVN